MDETYVTTDFIQGIRSPNKDTLKAALESTRRFTNVEWVGRGNFSEVYKGTLNNRTVAIKAINTKARKADFLREILPLKLLGRHKNVSYLIDSIPDLKCLIFEYANTKTLFHFLQKNVLTDDLKASLGSDIARGLNFLHFNNIIHRDIKLDNILVNCENGKYSAILGDLGIAYNRTSTILLPETDDEQNVWKRMDYSYDTRTLLFVLWQIDTGILFLDEKILNPQKQLREIDSGLPFEYEQIPLDLFSPLQTWWKDALLPRLVDENHRSVRLPSALMILAELETLRPSSTWTKHVFAEDDYPSAIQFILENNDFDKKQNMFYYLLQTPKFLPLVEGSGVYLKNSFSDIDFQYFSQLLSHGFIWRFSELFMETIKIAVGQDPRFSMMNFNDGMLNIAMMFAVTYLSEEIKREKSLIVILRSFLKRSHLTHMEEKLLSLEDQNHVLTTLGATLWHLWAKTLCDLQLNSQLATLQECFKTKMLDDSSEPILIQITNLHIFGMVYPRDQNVYEHLIKKTKHEDPLIRKAAVWAVSQTDVDEENTRKILVEIINKERVKNITKVAFAGLLPLSYSEKDKGILEELVLKKPELEETFLSSPLYLQLHKPVKM